MSEPVERELLALVAAALRELYGSAARAQSVEPWGIGALNDTLKVTVDCPAEALFFKVERAEILPRSRRGQVGREAAGIRLARAAGVAVPEVLAADPTGRLAGRPYLIERFIEGELLWELREHLSEAERAALKSDAAALLARMNGITSHLFGDLAPGGPLGQHATWPAAYQQAGALLLEDCAALDGLRAEELRRVESALARGAEALESRHPAGFHHGDLGLHNVLSHRTDGLARLGTVIDFGNAWFAPIYANEQGTRLHGGFGLDPLDVQARYGIGPEEQAANELLELFDMLVFFAMLQQRYGQPGNPFQQMVLARV